MQFKSNTKLYESGKALHSRRHRRESHRSHSSTSQSPQSPRTSRGFGKAQGSPKAIAQSDRQLQKIFDQCVAEAIEKISGQPPWIRRLTIEIDQAADRMLAMHVIGTAIDLLVEAGQEPPQVDLVVGGGQGNA